MYDRITNLTRSISVWTNIILKCSSSDESGSARKSWTSSDYIDYTPLAYNLHYKQYLEALEETLPASVYDPTTSRVASLVQVRYLVRVFRSSSIGLIFVEMFLLLSLVG